TLVPTFALAQTPATTPTSPSITKQMLEDAKKTQAACNALSSAIYHVTPNPGIGSYITEWIAGPPTDCRFLRVYRVLSNGNLDARADNTTVALWEAYLRQDESLI